MNTCRHGRHMVKKNGRHEETRTPDLYRVNSLCDVKPDDTE